MKYIEPSVFAKSYTCPHCGTVSKQDWWMRSWDGYANSIEENNPLRVGSCHHCGETTLWIFSTMYYPDKGNAPIPNPDMPQKVMQLYLEASAIHPKSPRGAAALLRLAIQVLCKELGQSGQNINSDIANLVKNGLPKIVQQSLDIVRVTGNDAVHPGQIDTDNPQTVKHLFELTNVIVEYMISLPSKVDTIYKSLPDDKLNGIVVRDKINNNDIG